MHAVQGGGGSRQAGRHGRRLRPLTVSHRAPGQRRRSASDRCLHFFRVMNTLPDNRHFWKSLVSSVRNCSLSSRTIPGPRAPLRRRTSQAAGAGSSPRLGGTSAVRFQLFPQSLPPPSPPAPPAPAPWDVPPAPWRTHPQRPWAGGSVILSPQSV